MLLIVLRVVGAVLAALVAAISLALNAADIGSDWNWRITSLVAAIFFIGFVAWGWGIAEWRLHRRPKIRVVPRLWNHNKLAMLEVRNIGNTGHFRATRQIVENGTRRSPMAAYWEQQGAEAIIHGGGGPAYIYIARIPDSPINTSPQTWFLEVAGVGSDGREQFETTGHYKFGSHPPLTFIRIEITWEENMPKPFSRTYLLEQDAERIELASFDEAPKL